MDRTQSVDRPDNRTPGTTRQFEFQGADEALGLLGQFNNHLKYVREQFDVQLAARGTVLRISGAPEEVERVYGLFAQLRAIWRDGHVPTLDDVRYLVEQTREGHDLTGVLSGAIQQTRWGETIKPKTVGQRRYLEAILHNDVVFGIGPSGTGKTYLAVAIAVAALKRGKVHRIVLTRPAVEAGEELGFLPGDLEAKVNPYLRPLYDAIFDMMPDDEVHRLMASRRIEVAPLAFMRGRTLNHSFMILDEAQNTTETQMKMFLTRMGAKAKAVITGDVTQVDLQGHASSLQTVQRILNGIKGIEFVHLDKTDVVRNRLIREIIEAYENAEQAPAR